MSDTLKTIFKWVGWFFLTIAGGAAGGAGSQVLF